MHEPARARHDLVFPSLISEGSIEATDRPRRTGWESLFPSLISEGSIEATDWSLTSRISASFPR